MNYNHGDNKSPDIFKDDIYAEKTYILMSSGPSEMQCRLTMTFPTELSFPASSLGE